MPPASSNESQGLKIAVAAFVSLTVILAVSCYFLYSSYDKALAAEAKAKDGETAARKAQAEFQNERDEYRKAIGTRAEDKEPALAEIKAEQKKADEKIVAIAAKVDALVAKAQQAGASGPELQQSKDNVKRLVQDYQNEPNKNYISTVSRLGDILENVTLELAAVSTGYTQTKRNLEAANKISQESINAQTEAAKKAADDTKAENENHIKQRADLLTKTDQYQTEIARQATEIASLQTEIRKLKEDSEKKINDLSQMLRDYREQLQKNEAVLDVPDGYVTYVDYKRGEVRTNLTRAMGLKPQMNMAIFDRHSPGVPTEKPKGTIQFIWVGDSYSIARITETKNAIQPIRVGDVVYSAAWSPNEPMRFALLGKIDVNRDGKDDRADLKRMIEAAGGSVDYDLPPPEAGKEKGKLTPKIAWYVVDERVPLRESFGKYKEESVENQQFIKKLSDAKREARMTGVRLMPIERLLSYLGYNFAAPVEGRTEAYDTNSMKNIVRPRQGGEGGKTATPAPDATAAPAAEPEATDKPKKDEGEKKDEMPKEDEK